MFSYCTHFSHKTSHIKVSNLPWKRVGCCLITHCFRVVARGEAECQTTLKQWVSPWEKLKDVVPSVPSTLCFKPIRIQYSNMWPQKVVEVSTYNTQIFKSLHLQVCCQFHITLLSKHYIQSSVVAHRKNIVCNVDDRAGSWHRQHTVSGHNHNH